MLWFVWLVIPHLRAIDALHLLGIPIQNGIACRKQTCRIMGSSRPEDGDTSQRHVKRATKVFEFLNLKTDGSLKNGKIQYLSDNELIRKQHMTRTSVASSVTGVTGGIVITLACPVVAVGLAITSTQMTVACINRHRVRREVKQRARNDVNFAKILSQQDRTSKKAGDIALGVSVRAALTVATMGIVGFDTVAQNLTDLGGAAVVGSAAGAATDATGTAAAVQAASHGAAHGASHVVSHAAVHAAGGAADPSSGTASAADHATTIHQQFTQAHPYAAAGDASLHKATQGISDKVAEVLSGRTGLQFTADSGLHEIQDVWHSADGDAKTKLVFLEQAVVDGGTAELVQPLQQASEYAVAEKARKWRWDHKAH